jgi:hypothetical protein
MWPPREIIRKQQGTPLSDRTVAISSLCGGNEEVTLCKPTGKKANGAEELRG